MKKTYPNLDKYVKDEFIRNLIKLTLNYPNASAILHFILAQKNGICYFEKLEEFEFKRNIVLKNIKILEQEGFIKLLEIDNVKFIAHKI